MNIKSTLNGYASYFEANICHYFQTGDEDIDASIIKSMLYSLGAGGKRIRPALVFMFSDEYEKAMPFAAAVEFIHTYSLIHDDLPCMDNDDYRRGKLSNHKVFGEGMAVLAGDALLNFAFENILLNSSFDSDITLKATKALAINSGVQGMVGGQVLDISGKCNDIKSLTKMCRMKTGALIKAACVMGSIIGGYNDVKIKNAEKYAENIGLAFQIVDDVLDMTGDEKKLGKKVGSDEKNNKITFATLLGVDGAKKMALELTDECSELVKDYKNSEELIELSKYLLKRES